MSKKVLITGCSSGFGYDLALQASGAGYNVIATMRDMQKARFLTEAAENLNTSLTIEKLDVNDPQAVNHVVDRHGPFDILVNNAGILIIGSFLDATEQEIHQVLETNFFSAVRTTRAVAPGMIEQGHGLIINIASLAGLVGHMFNSAYSASKHALVGFSRSIKLELKPFNVKVVSVEPGYHKTEIIRANANISQNFYDRTSPMFQYNRAFLRLMHDEIVPRAADPKAVVSKIMEIMSSPNPKDHYLIGKDARLAMAFNWLKLGKIVENKIMQKLYTAARRENRRELTKKQNRKKAKNT